ncbi:MAG: response regulator [Bacteroidales bacterium]|nr:response regulator [Bacteroidales bacterium]
MDYVWNNYTALIAEDDPLNYKYIELLLTKRTGINILWAADGVLAANMCKENRNIDIVLLDLQLPELDGINSLQIIKKYNPYLPVIIQTANSWNNEEETCAQAGCDGFFNKPLNMDQLLLHMDQCLRTYSLIRHTQMNS